MPWTSSVKEGRMVEREGAGMDGEERAGGEESRMQVAIKYILEVFSEVSTWVFLTERPLFFAFSLLAVSTQIIIFITISHPCKMGRRNDN